MAEGNASAGLTKPRSVLGDLTNILGKRGFSERENTGNKTVNHKANDKDLVKRVRVSSTEINSLKGNVVSSTSNVTDEIRDDNHVYCLKEKNPLIGDSKFHIGNDKLAVVKDMVDSSDEIGHSGNDTLPNMNNNNTTENEVPEIAQSKFGGSTESKVKKWIDLDREQNVVEYVNIDRFHDRDKVCDGDGSKVSRKGNQNDIHEYHDHDWDFGNLVLSQSGSIDGTFLPDSQESEVFGIELNKGNERASNICEGTESIKACCCSFCMKAGYILMDLNYKDIKARVSALRKSQKEASIQAERIIKSKGTEKHGVSKLESDLMYEWRSLFQHTVDVIEHEANQLEARLLPLNDLRDKCKTDLELIGAEKRKDEF